MLRKTILVLPLLLGLGVTTAKSTVYGDGPTELPAIVVNGWVEDDYGFQWANLIWTLPYNTYGAQNMKGLQYAASHIAYGRMINTPQLLHGPYHNLGSSHFGYSTGPVRIDTDGDPREQGFDPKWSPNTSYPGLNAAVTPYVAYTDAAVAAGVGPGDWAQIHNSSNGNWIWAICGDYCDGHPENEISEAAAWLMGWPFYANSDTQFVVHSYVLFWPHSKGL